MRGMPAGARRVTAVVAALVVLSIVLGETRDARAAGVALDSAAALAPPGWARLDPALVVGHGGDWGEQRTTVTLRARLEQGSHGHVRAIAGIPPWIIWPPSPMPRIVGTMLRRPTLTAFVGFHPSALQVGWRPTSALPPAPTGDHPQPARAMLKPPARLAGADHSIPRPPPSTPIS